MNNIFKYKVLDKRFLSLLLAFTLILTSLSGILTFASEGTEEDNKAFELIDGLYELKDEYKADGSKNVTHYRYKDVTGETEPGFDDEDDEEWNDIADFELPPSDGEYLFQFSKKDSEEETYEIIMIDDYFIPFYNHAITTLKENVDDQDDQGDMNDDFVAEQLELLDEVYGEQRTYAINFLKEKCLAGKTITVEALNSNIEIEVDEVREYRFVVKVEGQDLDELVGFPNLIEDISWTIDGDNVEIIDQSVDKKTIKLKGLSVGKAILKATIEGLEKTFEINIVEPEIEEPVGTIIIKYHDTDGNSIKDDLVETDVTGSKTYTAPEIESYNLPTENTITLTIETDGETKEHIFVYEKIEEILLEAPEVSLTFSDGKMNLVIDKKNEGKETTLLYKLSSEANFKEFDLNVNNLADGTYTYNFKVKQGSVESSVVNFTLINENNKVSTIKESIDTLVGTEITSENYIAVKNIIKQRTAEIEELKHEEQKDFLTTELDKAIEKLETFEESNPALSIEIEIESLPTTKLIEKSSVDNILEKIDKIEAQATRSSMLELLGKQLAKNTHYTNRLLNRTSNDLNKFYDEYYSNRGYLRVNRYDLGITDENYVVYMYLNNVNKDSNNYKAIETGEFEEWFEKTIIKYLKDDFYYYLDRDVEFRMFGNDGKEMKKLTYSADILRRYDYRDFEDIKDSLELAYEYLEFDIRMFSNNDEINVVLVGLFDKTDNDWTKRDAQLFNDYLVFNIAEPIISEIGKTVNIIVLDRKDEVLLTRTVEEDDINSDDESLGVLRMKLNNNYSNYENLEFTYQLVRGARVINVRMIGQNFRENSRVWENINEYDFKNWIIEKVGKMVIADTDLDVNIKVYDSSRRLLIDIDLDKRDHIASHKDLEDDLNYMYDYFNGIYFEYIVRGSNAYTNVTMEADVRLSSSEWKDLDEDEFEDWLKYELVDFIMEEIPRYVTINLRDSSKRHIKTYSFTFEGFKELIEKEKEYNTDHNVYAGLEFDIRLTKEGSTVTVRFNGKDFRSSDSKWKDVNKKAFEAWIEENIVLDLLKIFKSGVRVQVYDSRGLSLMSKTYRSNHLETRDKEIIRDLERKLKSDYKTFSGLDFDYSIKRDVNGDIVLTMKGRNFAEKDNAWTKLNKNDFDEFLKVIGNLVKIEFPKDDVVINVLDRRGTELAYKEIVGIVDLDDINIVKNSSNKYIYLNESLFENVSGNVKTYTVETGYINLLKNDTDLKDKVLFINMDEMATNVLKLPKALITNLGSSSTNIGFGNNEVLIEVNTKTATNDTSIEIKKAGSRTNLLGNRWIISGIYEIKSDLGKSSKDNKAVSLTFHFEDYAKYRKDFGIYKQNKTTNVWEKQKGKLDSLTNTIILDNPADGKYALIYEGKEFTDIQGSKYRSDILRLVDKGVITGKTETIFDPFAKITRAEFVTLLVKGLGYDNGNPTTTPFEDVNPNDWFFRYVELARQNDLVAGKSAKKFAPNDFITREEVVTVLVRLNRKMASPKQTKQAPVPFGYNASISNWAFNYVNEAKSVGIIPNEVFDFYGTEASDRDETAHYIYNLLKINGQY